MDVAHLLAGIEGPTTSWQARFLPLADPAAEALTRLKARGDQMVSVFLGMMYVTNPPKILGFAGISSDGANRDRTGDLLLAKQALSQLSYGPRAPTIRPHTASAAIRRITWA
jgi:hypothetical protein